MIIDFDAQSVGSAFQADVCVIGSGAAGITVSREFIGTRTSVVLLEGGGDQFEAACQEPYLSVIRGLPHRGVHHGRARTLGGTTTLWAGQALPLFDIDFERRDWVPYSGWPITRSELLPYYRRAEHVMQLPHRTYDRETWPRKITPAFRADGSLEACYSQFAVVPNFAKKYKQDLLAAGNVTVLTHANAVSLEPAQDCQSLTSVQVKSFKGRSARVFARFFVVCCGGIDSARLLLASNSVQPTGIGNSHDVVGRFFQDHPSVFVPITPCDRVRFDNQFGAVRSKSALHIIKIHPSSVFQRENRILNVGAELVYSTIEDDPIAALRNLKAALFDVKSGRANARNLASAIRQPGKLLRAVYSRCMSGRWHSPAYMQSQLFVSCEQEPSWDSRISLSEERDNLGMRRAVVDWRLTKLVTASSTLR